MMSEIQYILKYNHSLLQSIQGLLLYTFIGEDLPAEFEPSTGG